MRLDGSRVWLIYNHPKNNGWYQYSLGEMNSPRILESGTGPRGKIRSVKLCWTFVHCQNQTREMLRLWFFISNVSTVYFEQMCVVTQDSPPQIYIGLALDGRRTVWCAPQGASFVFINNMSTLWSPNHSLTSTNLKPTETSTWQVIFIISLSFSLG